MTVLPAAGRAVALTFDAGADTAGLASTLDTLAAEGGGMTEEKVVDRVTAALVPGEIVLMHVGANPDDGSTLDADALPEVIAALRAAGYGFTTLDALFT